MGRSESLVCSLGSEIGVVNSGLGFRIFEVLGFTSRGGLESFAGYPQMRDSMWQGLPKGKLDPWETPCGIIKL